MNTKNLAKLFSLFFSVAVVYALVQPYFLDALTVGSNANNTTIRQLASVTFAAAPNSILGFTSIQGGFSLPGFGTAAGAFTCTWNALLPVTNGRLRLFGGQLSLLKDLTLGGTTLSITGSGTILAGGNTVTFGPFISDFSITHTLILDTATMALNQNIKLYSSLRFQNRGFGLSNRGTCKINGNGKRITFRGNGQLEVLPGCNLIIENAALWGVKKNNLRCSSDNGSITFRNCSLCLTQDFTFSSGSFLVDDQFVITGTSDFIYTTGLTSTIGSCSTLFLDMGTTFSYQPRRARNNLIFMSDATSNLYLYGCTLYSTRTGLQLSTGTLIIDDSVTFTSEARSMSEAMIISADLTAKVLAGASADFYGLIRYD